MAFLQKGMLQRCLQPSSIAARSYGKSNHRWMSSTAALEKVGVIGLGLMGHGICQVAAASGKHSQVIAYEPQQEFLDRGKDRITTSLSKLVQKQKMTQDAMDATLGRITFTTNMSDLSQTDMIVEAIQENVDIKRELYTNLGQMCKPSTIFASNTSSLSITDMAVWSGRPSRLVGVHFFNPVQLMKLVEVISTSYTDPAVFSTAFQWVQDIGKVPVKCGDTPGFIVNRLLVPALMQAMLMVDRKDASIADIDISLQLGAGHPMGPLHLADYIGLDTCLFIVQGWTEKYPNEAAFVIPKCLEEKVQAGHLGRKSGQGFYHWKGDQRGDPVE